MSFPFLQPQNGSSQDSLELLAIRKSILRILLIISALVGTVAYFSNVFSLVLSRSYLLLAVQTVIYAALLVIAVVDRLPYNARKHSFLLIVALLAISDLVESGLAGEGRLFLLVFSMMCMLLLETRAGVRLFLVSLAILVLIGASMVTGLLPLPAPAAIDDSGSAGAWLTGGLIYGLMAFLVLAAMLSLIRGLETALLAQKKLAAELEHEHATLEQRVRARTAILERQARLMELTSTYTLDISRLAGLDPFLNYTTTFFQERLGFENVAVYLIDPSGDFFVLHSCLGEQAQSLKEHLGRLRVNQPQTLGELITSPSSRWIKNAGDDAVYFRNTNLAGLTSMVFLPLRTNEVIGAVVLLVKDENDQIAEETLAYQGIADQLANGLEKSRLMYELQRNVEEVKASGQQQTQQTWRSYLKASRRSHQYVYRHKSIHPGAPDSQASQTAMQQNQVVITRIPGEGENQKGMTTIAIPISLRDQSFGVIDISFEGDNPPANLVALVEAVTKRLALALENARLVEEVQTRAERERLVGNIGSRIRSSSDVDSILKVAAVEIGRSLGAAEVLVQLHTDHVS